ncbi:MAG: DNA mismatch repair protein MutS [Thermomicrobiales bacterium]|nr:DNA mismatch repair protein MutS [Thermomicrobiales bacterium]
MVITPARQQYLQLKAEQPDAILLYRMGDFYEMFDEDAHTAARVLGITLTSREFGRAGRVPMAGIPYHALNGYLRRFLRAGYRLAICEQLSEPGKGLVERGITRVLSSGTIDDPALLDAGRPNLLLSLVVHGALVGLAWVDVSTGACEYRALPVDDLTALATFVDQLDPAEIVGPEADDLEIDTRIAIRPIAGEWTIDAATRLLESRFPGCEPIRPAAALAVAVLITYLERGQPALLKALEAPLPYQTDGIMVLDRQTRLNLEIDLRSRERHDLFGLLNRTHTAPGARRLRALLNRPLLDRDALGRRLDAVEELVGDTPLRSGVAKALSGLLDLERLAARVATGAARANELLALADTLDGAERVRAVLRGRAESTLLVELAADIAALPDVRDRIRAELDNGSSRLLRTGIDRRLDLIYAAIDRDRDGIAAMERSERERTGIRTLKVGYNKVFGYYLEITRAHRDKAPADYIRKQTLTNAERFVTPALKEAESRIVANEERAAELESELFARLVRELGESVAVIRTTAAALATIDALVALATVAVEQRFVRPALDDSTVLHIEGGRHPIVERQLPYGEFVPNDTRLNEDAPVVILTGPNMAGKSTWLRQVALIVFLAQIGSFVPADRARIGLVDRIFTRIGAHDDLANGRSTFMVEMLETATILHHATERSLVVLDEIGRGTSTEDGVAIAGAVVEHLIEWVGARTLFATHFRELAEIAAENNRVVALQTAIKQHPDGLVFLHAIVPGIAEAAFGLEIARLAGLPTSVIQRAQTSFGKMTRQIPTVEAARSSAADVVRERVANDVLAVDLANTTPLAALNLLASWQQRLRAADDEPIGPRALLVAEDQRAAQAD